MQVTAFANVLRKEANDWLATDGGKKWASGYDKVSYGVFPESKGTFCSGPMALIPEWVKPDPNPEISPVTPFGKHPKLLQWWGTEYRRAQDSQYWVNKWKQSLNPLADIVIATDMRFRNEAAVVKEVGGYTVNVVRLNQDGMVYVDPSRSAMHPSEIDMDGYNYDYAIHSKDAALTGEFAVTLVHFLRARATKGKN